MLLILLQFTHRIVLNSVIIQTTPWLSAVREHILYTPPFPFTTIYIRKICKETQSNPIPQFQIVFSHSILAHFLMFQSFHFFFFFHCAKVIRGCSHRFCVLLSLVYLVEDPGYIYKRIVKVMQGGGVLFIGMRLGIKPFGLIVDVALQYQALDYHGTETNRQRRMDTHQQWRGWSSAAVAGPHSGPMLTKCTMEVVFVAVL